MDPDLILQEMTSAAKKAGAFIRRERENFDYASVETKGLNDLVSHVDRRAEEMIVSELRRILPEAGYIVEENSAGGRADYNWIVDPLDGTTNFIHGIPSYAVSIALEHHGGIICGVVYEVARDEMFSARKDKGAFLNGAPIRVSKRPRLSEALVGTGFPIQNFSRIEPFLSALKYFMEHTHGVRRIGAAAADLCYLACGRLDAFFEYNLNSWDVAAGALIVKESGGSVTDFSGGDNWLFGKEICCTNGLLKDEFGERIRKIFEQ